MLTVGIVDANFRTRDVKEITAMQEMFPKDVKFVFMTVLPEDRKLPGVKKYYLHPKNQVNEIQDICKHEKIDVLHTHNFPDTYGWWGVHLKEKIGIPVVHECHDIGYENISPEQQKITSTVMKGVDHIICVSEGMVKYLHLTFGVGSKCSIIYSYPNRKYIPNVVVTQKMTYTRGVYQGGINQTISKGGSYNHRFYRSIFQKLARQGLKMDIYPASNKQKINYMIKGVNEYTRIDDQKTLFQTLAAYDFGFVGYNPTSSIVMNIAMPNKLFEYIACGLPILAMNYDLISDFITTNKFGVVVDKQSLSLPPNFHKVMAMCRKNVLQKRLDYTMERQAIRLLKIYKSVTK